VTQHLLDVAAVAAGLTEHLPADDVTRLATAALGGPQQIMQLKACASSGAVRSACDDVLELLGKGIAEAFIAGALQGAAHAVHRARAQATTDVVWTGPPSPVTNSRLTSVVVTDLVDTAREEILLVSFATHPSSGLLAALQAAVERGVFVTLLLERAADNPGYSNTADPFAPVHARRLAWPSRRRPAGAALHAKVIVIDRSTALVGSANITSNAMDRNLECGVLLRGGPHPARIHDHVLGLLDRDELAVVQPAAPSPCTRP
jgi:phosphatidylserine/phosphatidylglycerophosphate/cardiolipin synthase-like enzyme